MNKENKYDFRNISAVILSAGRSGRFGKPKALIPFDETKSFLQKILFEYFNAGITNIVLVINAELKDEVQAQIHALPSGLKINVVINPHPEAGRFTSIKLAVNAIENCDQTFIQNIDNPFTTSELLLSMINKIKTTDADYVVPVYFGERGHPVLMSNIILKHIIKMKSSEGNLRDVLNEYSPALVNSGDPYILANINTPEEYSIYFNYKENEEATIDSNRRSKRYR